MRVIAEAARAGALAVDVRVVLSDRADAPGLATARTLGIDSIVVSPRAGAQQSEYDRELAATVRGYRPELLVFAGFMRILSADFVAEFLGRALNIHPSLLPKYRGLHTHARVLEAKETEHGASVHFVTPELDGGPVVSQGRLQVRPNDDEKSLTVRVQALEHRIYPESIAWLASGRLRWNDGKVQLDGAPLRTPRITEERDL
jgi:phosphoribosylglycinamide formyltransferase 1